MKFGELSLYQQEINKLGGVVSIADFANLVGLSDSQKINSALKKCIECKIIKRFINGFYLSDNFDPELLCQKIYPESYLSLGTILAKNLIIGSVPQMTIYAVKLGRNKEFNNCGIRIIYFSISKDLFLDFEFKNGIKYASKEKAFLDLLYYYQKGFVPSFNIYSDLNLSLLKRSKVDSLLTNYNNVKFRSFVQKLLDDYEY